MKGILCKGMKKHSLCQMSNCQLLNFLFEKKQFNSMPFFAGQALSFNAYFLR